MWEFIVLVLVGFVCFEAGRLQGNFGYEHSKNLLEYQKNALHGWLLWLCFFEQNEGEPPAKVILRHLPSDQEVEYRRWK